MFVLEIMLLVSRLLYKNVNNLKIKPVISYNSCRNCAIWQLTSTLKSFPKNYVKTRRNFSLTVPNLSKSNFIVNTNVSTDVLIYRYEKPEQFRKILMFGLGAFTFFMVTAVISLPQGNQRKIEYEGDSTTYQWAAYLNNSNAIRAGYAGFMGLAALSILGFSLYIPHRTVRSIILNRGGKSVDITTYAVSSSPTFKCSLDDLTTTTSRKGKGKYMPIKNKSTKFNYLVNRSGEFPQIKLFDHTVGVKRF